MPRFVSAHLTSYCSKKIYAAYTGPHVLCYNGICSSVSTATLLLHDILNCGQFFKSVRCGRQQVGVFFFSLFLIQEKM